MFVVSMCICTFYEKPNYYLFYYVNIAHCLHVYPTWLLLQKKKQ